MRQEPQYKTAQRVRTTTKPRVEEKQDETELKKSSFQLRDLIFGSNLERQNELREEIIRGNELISEIKLFLRDANKLRKADPVLFKANLQLKKRIRAVEEVLNRQQEILAQSSESDDAEAQIGGWRSFPSRISVVVMLVGFAFFLPGMLGSITLELIFDKPMNPDTLDTFANQVIFLIFDIAKWTFSSGLVGTIIFHLAFDRKLRWIRQKFLKKKTKATAELESEAAKIFELLSERESASSAQKCKLEFDRSKYVAKRTELVTALIFALCLPKSIFPEFKGIFAKE